MKSEEDFIIEVTDHLLNVCPDFGVFNAVQKIIGFPFNSEDFYLSKKIKEAASMNRFDFAVDFAKEKGYIFHPPNNTRTDMYELTDLGREVKRKGGHLKYRAFINEKDNAIFENIRYASEAAQAAKESATAAKESTGYNKSTMYLIAAYTTLTLILVVTTIVMCNQNRRVNNIHNNAAVSTKEAKANNPTDTVK